MTGACRFSTASPLPRRNVPPCGGWDYEAYEDSLTFTRPVFPLPAAPGWNENGFGFFPGLCTPQLPMTHTEAGTALLTLDRVTPSPMEPPNGVTTHHVRLSTSHGRLPSARVGSLANETKLAANRTNAGARPPREGSALCQGIITCGSCGRPMRTNYHTDQRPSYECARRADGLTTATCRSIAASTVDTAVADRLLAALNPAEVALALAAADDVTDRHQRISRAAELALERARYEADRAERAFCQVEPENRLVARTLETRWETKLAALSQTEHACRVPRVRDHRFVTS
jgi:hypothetical protein